MGTYSKGAFVFIISKDPDNPESINANNMWPCRILQVDQNGLSRKYFIQPYTGYVETKCVDVVDEECLLPVTKYLIGIGEGGGKNIWKAIQKMKVDMDRDRRYDFVRSLKPIENVINIPPGYYDDRDIFHKAKFRKGSFVIVRRTSEGSTIPNLWPGKVIDVHLHQRTFKYLLHFYEQTNPEEVENESDMYSVTPVLILMVAPRSDLRLSCIEKMLDELEEVKKENHRNRNRKNTKRIRSLRPRSQLLTYNWDYKPYDGDNESSE